MGLHDGHRRRMMEKLSKGVLLEHEYLEVMLFPFLPRRNTNELAHRLLARFGSIPSVLEASMEQLQQVEGVGENIAGHIHLLGIILREYYPKDEKYPYPETFTSEAFLPYVKEEYKNLRREVLDVYFLDPDGRVIGNKRFGDEDYFTAEVPPNHLARLIIEYMPSGVVLVHNHPFGEAIPSDTDDTMTKHCQVICSSHNVLFCDHFIYAPSGVYSYYLSGKMQEISENYSLQVLSKEGGKARF